MVSDSLKEAGEQQIMIVVRAFPPNDSCNIRVNFESRYGIWVFLSSANADITFPKADNDLLIFLASSNTVPSAPVLLTWSNINIIRDKNIGFWNLKINFKY